MTDQDTAADHLRTIRAMMERATIYRAISGPAALFGGLVALWTGLAIGNKAMGAEPQNLDPITFFSLWIGVLILTGIFNTFLIWRGSKQRGEPFCSSGMKLALRAIVPPMLAGGVISWFSIESNGSQAQCALLWVVFYSLALLASGNFAPRSMRNLGRMFFAAGLGLFLLLHFFGQSLGETFSKDQVQAGLIMALTFGAMHIFYAFRIIFLPKEEQR